MSTLKDLGVVGALSSVPGYNAVATLKRGPDAVFSVYRFAYPDGLPRVIACVAGIERAKQLLRREMS